MIRTLVIFISAFFITISICAQAFTPNPITPPNNLKTMKMMANVTSESWNYTVENEVLVGYEGNDVYIKGLAGDFADAWLHGTLSGTTITFPQGQFLDYFGEDGYSYEMYACGFTSGGSQLCDFILNRNAETGALSTPTGMGIGEFMEYNGTYYDIDKLTNITIIPITIEDDEANNETTIVVGDMNGDGQLTIADVSLLTETIIGQIPQRAINVNSAELSPLVGVWRSVDGKIFEFGADGGVRVLNSQFENGSCISKYDYSCFRNILVFMDDYEQPLCDFSVIRKAQDILILKDNEGYLILYPDVLFATHYSIDKSELDLSEGESEIISITFTPEDSFKPNVNWTSSNTDIAIVDDKGCVTALKVGSATITAEIADGKGTMLTCNINVLRKVENIIISTNNITLDLDETFKLTATVLPENATNTGYTWTSSDENIAQVTKNGIVVATGYGSCIITATANDGSGVKAECNVTVKEL